MKYLRGDKGEAMDNYMNYCGDNTREPYLQSIYKLFKHRAICLWTL